MCKHVAAVLYGVGARLDDSPELLFTLRQVDHLELIEAAVAAKNLDTMLAANGTPGLESQDLGEIFGIEIDGQAFNGEPESSKKTESKEKRPKVSRRSKPTTTNLTAVSSAKKRANRPRERRNPRPSSRNEQSEFATAPIFYQ